MACLLQLVQFSHLRSRIHLPQQLQFLQRYFNSFTATSIILRTNLASTLASKSKNRLFDTS